MRTAEQEAQFHRDRSTAIGGSDVQHLLSLPPYGCKRRLWYDKKGVAADFPFLGNRHTRRGEELEPIAIREFLAGENLSGEGRVWEVTEERSHVGAHVDHIIWSPNIDLHSRGVLEVKVPSSRNYYTLCAKGPSEASRLQLQWGMLTAKVNWGIILLFNADVWRYRHWRFPRDPGMIQDLLVVADQFWASLDSDRPRWPQLDPQSRACQDCPWRKRCQGIARETPLNLEEMDDPSEPPEVDESFFDLAAAYIAAKAMVADAEKAKEAARDAIIARLGGRPRKLRCSAATISYAEVVTAPSAPAPKPERRHLALTVRPAKAAPLDGDDYDEIETD